MLRTLAAEAARRFGQRVSFGALGPAEIPQAAELTATGEVAGEAAAAHPAALPQTPAEPSPAAAHQAPAPPAGGWRLSYADLDRLSDEAAAGLAFRGVLPGDVVAVALPAVPEFPICYLAAAKIGAVIAGVDPRWPPAVLDRLAGLFRPTMTIAPSGSKVGPGPDGEVLRVTLAADGGAALTGLRRAEPPPPPLPPDSARPVVIAVGYGTASVPRGAVFGVSQLDAIRAAEAGNRWGSAAGSVVLTALPFAHYSLMTRLPAMLQSGQSCFLMDSWRPERVPGVAAAVQANQVTCLPGQIAELAAWPLPADAAPPALELIVSRDAAVPAGLVPALRERLGAGVQLRYECAEAGLGLRTHPGDRAGDVDGYVGGPAPGVTLALRDEDQEVPRGEFGEVLLRSAACMSGYWNEPQASAAAFTSDRFVRTGDRGRIDEQGRLVLATRVPHG
jgi:acyl-CoA synthetase (AMP-forming)/AMP-acid ligase II